jgi:transcriptional regulator with XRE-family HTH domain
MTDNHACEREYDFALILSGVSELTTEVEDALFKAGCDDATLSIQYGLVYMEFSRMAPSLKDAILSAIRDVRKANIGANVWRVDECDLVTPAEIARRIGRSRQLVHQYMIGKRGPGGFPPPACHLTEGAPLWLWCEVSFWLCQNDMIRPEQLREAEVVAAINNALELANQRGRNPELVDEVTQAVAVQ